MAVPGNAIVAVAEKYLFVRENPPSSNRGPEIDRWLKGVGSPLGSAWCAALVWGVLDEAQERPSLPRSGRVQTMVDGGVLLPASKAVEGDLIVFYFKNLGRYAHIAICQKNTKKFLTTIDGNSIADGAAGDQREGWGVFSKTRAISDRIKVLRPKP